MKNEIMTQQVEENGVLGAEATTQLLINLDAKEALLVEYAQKAKMAADAAEAALSNANHAKDAADDAKTKVRKELEIGFFKKGKAIRDLNDRVKTVTEALSNSASAQVVLAKAQKDLASAQKNSLECQKKLAQISVAMVQLGCVSIANSRIVVQQLEKRLQGASEDELNEMARAEIDNVIAQIRDQQDMLSRQEQLAEIVHGHDDYIHENMIADAERDRAIMEQMERGMERDGKIAAQARRSEEHHRVLVMQNKRNEEVERTLKQHERVAESIQKNVSLNANRLETQGRVLDQNVQVLKAFDERILINANVINGHATKLNRYAEVIEENGQLLQRHAERLDVVNQMLANNEEDIRTTEEDLKKVFGSINTIIGENKRRDVTVETCCERISAVEEAILLKDIEINELREKIDALQKELQTKASNTMLYVLGGSGAAGLILSLIQFLI